MKEFTLEEVEYLQDMGYRVKFLDDLSGWWLAKNIKTKYFGNCEISVSEFQNNVWINVDRERGDIDSNDLMVQFVNTPYSREDLYNIEKTLIG